MILIQWSCCVTVVFLSLNTEAHVEAEALQTHIVCPVHIIFAYSLIPLKWFCTSLNFHLCACVCVFVRNRRNYIISYLGLFFSHHLFLLLFPTKQSAGHLFFILISFGEHFNSIDFILFPPQSFFLFFCFVLSRLAICDSRWSISSTNKPIDHHSICFSVSSSRINTLSFDSGIFT